MTIATFHTVSPAQYALDTAGMGEALSLAQLPLPRRATSGSAGYDFVSPIKVTIAPGEQVTIPTGIRAEMQPGWVLLLCPRSSLGRKYRVQLANTVGIVDSDYALADNEGHILVSLVNHGAKPLTLSPGDRFCQGIFLPYGLAEEEEIQGERTGGFGSTGK